MRRRPSEAKDERNSVQHSQNICSLCTGNGDVERAENGLELLVLCLFSAASLQPGTFCRLSEALVGLVPYAFVFCKAIVGPASGMGLVTCFSLALTTRRVFHNYQLSQLGFHLLLVFLCCLAVH